MSDLLAKYRQAQSDSNRDHPEIRTLEGKPYKAFEFATSSQRWLDLRPARDVQRMVLYSGITDILHFYGQAIGLVFRGQPLHVDIRGKNLHELTSLIREGRATVITEYIPDWHAYPPEGEPIIESIDVTTPANPEPAKSRPAKH